MTYNPLKHLSMLITLIKYCIFYVVFTILKAFRIIKKHIPTFSFDPDIYRVPSEMIINQGYPYEEHKIVTEDKYILTAWRINLRTDHPQKYPIILQHGLLDSSMTWILNDPHRSLAYILADMGYDVWMTNNRGTRYSREHKVYINKMDNWRYWDFSFDEMAQYDIPANFEYIKNVTKAKQIIYIGHSQGTTQMFAHLCMKPEFKANIKAFIGLGPVTAVGNQESVVVSIMKRIYLFEIMRTLRENTFLVATVPKMPVMGEVTSLFPKTCYDVIKMICGETRQNHVDLKKIGVICSHEPAGSSDKNLIHWMQNMRSGKFNMFDYGRTKNRKMYGSSTVPEYPLENLRKFDTPKILFRGEIDYLADQKDYITLLDHLPKENTISEIVEDYGHLDYCWAIDAKEKIYGKIIDFLKLQK